MSVRQKRRQSSRLSIGLIENGMVHAIEALVQVPMGREAFVKAVLPAEQWARLHEAKIWAREVSMDFEVSMSFPNGTSLILSLRSADIVPPRNVDATGRLDEPMFAPFARIAELAQRWKVVERVATFWHNDRYKYPLPVVKYYWPAGVHLLNDGQPVSLPAKFMPIPDCPMEDIRESATVLAMEKLLPKHEPSAATGLVCIKTGHYFRASAAIRFNANPYATGEADGG